MQQKASISTILLSLSGLTETQFSGITGKLKITKKLKNVINSIRRSKVRDVSRLQQTYEYKKCCAAMTEKLHSNFIKCPIKEASHLYDRNMQHCHEQHENQTMPK